MIVNGQNDGGVACRVSLAHYSLDFIAAETVQKRRRPHVHKTGHIIGHDRRRYAAPRHGGEATGHRNLEVLLMGRADHRGRDRMLAVPLRTRRYPQRIPHCPASNACTAETRGLPSIRVPVLSNATISTPDVCSITTADFINTP